MAQFTTEVLSIIRTLSDENSTLIEQITEAAPKIFNFDFPIWDESYRLDLEIKILSKYLRREISYETVGLWKHYLWQTLNEIMPYYNQLYLTTLETFNPNNELDITTILNRGVKSNLTEKGTGTNTVTGENVGKDFPQSVVSGTDAQFYASQSQKIDNTTSGESDRTADSTNDENSTQTRKGRLGTRTQGEIILSFRNSILDIDTQIINDLNFLFFPLYESFGGSFLTGGSPYGFTT